jgi:hypothetical protein
MDHKRFTGEEQRFSGYFLEGEWDGDDDCLQCLRRIAFNASPTPQSNANRCFLAKAKPTILKFLSVLAARA